MPKGKTAAVILTTGLAALGGVGEAPAQTDKQLSDLPKETTEMTVKNLMVDFQQSPDMQQDSVMDWKSAKQLYEETKGEGGPSIEPDPEEGGESEEGNVDDSQLEKENSQSSKVKKESPIDITYSVGAGSEFLDGSGSLLSPNASYSFACGVAHKSGLGISAFRLSDLKNTSTNPGSRLTQLAVSYNKKIGLPNDWNIFLSGSASYLNFDNKFMADDVETNLNEFSGFFQIAFKGKILSFELSSLYNAFLNGISPNSVINKAAIGVNVGEKTKVTGAMRWEINKQNEQAFRAAVLVNHKFAENFSAYLGMVSNLGDSNIKPNLVLGGQITGALNLFKNKNDK